MIVVLFMCKNSYLINLNDFVLFIYKDNNLICLFINIILNVEVYSSL